MKKIILTLIIAALNANVATMAQKLIIGSEIPSLKEIKWQTTPPTKGKPMLIDFYQSTNPSCIKFIPKLEKIQQTNGSQLSIVILTRDTGENLDKLVAAYGTKYHIGYDPTGDTFNNFYVKYLPYTMLVSSKSDILWLGNLGNITDSALQKIE